jgi:methylated-DNA-[protein]-cysteine S-methyltransferase
MTELAWAMLRTPVGPVSVGCSEVGVSQVRFGAPPRSASLAGAAPGATRGLSDTARGLSNTARGLSNTARGLSDAARAQLAEYFAGQRRRFDLPIDWSRASRLQQQVLGLLFETVGYGETVSYGTLARRVQSASRVADLPARVIGQVMGSNPVPVIVPCHRVVASAGLGGYSGGQGLEVKRWLLVFEGALPPTLDWELAGLPA